MQLITPANRGFNTQPPEGGCHQKGVRLIHFMKVSTHSHPKVAASNNGKSAVNALLVSTHSHPKVAAKILYKCYYNHNVSTHSHPKVAAPHIKKQEKSAD